MQPVAQISTAEDLWRLCVAGDSYMDEEAVKPILKGADARDAQQVLYWGAEHTLRLLAPFTPYLAEELWQRLPAALPPRAPSICVAEYPRPRHMAHWKYPEEAQRFDFVHSAIRTLRRLRTEFNLTKARPEVVISCHREEDIISLQSFLLPLRTLSLCEPVHIQLSSVRSLEGKDWIGWATADVTDSCLVYMNLQGLVDPQPELAKLQQKLEKLECRLHSKKSCKKEDDEDDSLLQKISSLHHTIRTLQKMVED